MFLEVFCSFHTFCLVCSLLFGLYWLLHSQRPLHLAAVTRQLATLFGNLGMQAEAKKSLLGFGFRAVFAIYFLVGLFSGQCESHQKLWLLGLFVNWSSDFKRLGLPRHLRLEEALGVMEAGCHLQKVKKTFRFSFLLWIACFLVDYKKVFHFCPHLKKWKKIQKNKPFPLEKHLLRLVVRLVSSPLRQAIYWACDELSREEALRTKDELAKSLGKSWSEEAAYRRNERGAVSKVVSYLHIWNVESYLGKWNYPMV